MSVLILVLGGCLLTQGLHFMGARKHAVAEAKGELPLRIPFTDREGLIMLTATLDGSTAARLIFDTGAPATGLFVGPGHGPKLDVSKARKLGPAKDPAVPVGAFSYDHTLDLGALELSALPVVAIPTSSLACKERLAELGVDGAIGLDLLRHYVIEIGDAELVLHDPAAFTPLADATLVPLEMAAGHLFVRGAVHSPDVDRTGLLQVDTGATDALQFLVGGPGDFLVPEGSEVRNRCLVDGMEPSWVGKHAEVTIDGASIPDVDVVYTDREHAVIAHEFATIGADVIRPLHPVFDVPHERMWLRP